MLNKFLQVRAIYFIAYWVYVENLPFCASFARTIGRGLCVRLE